MRTTAAAVKRIILLLIITSSAACADTFYVRQGGNDQNDGKTAKTAFKSLLRAAQALNYGDGIVIGPGAYKETVLIAERYAADSSFMEIIGDENGKLTGDTAGPVIIQPASLSAPALRISRARNMIITGLTFRGPGDGLALEKSLGVSVERCTFSQMRRGLNARLLDGLTVRSSLFERNTVALCASGTSNVRIGHCTIANSSSVGVLVLGCGPGMIRSSILGGNNTNILIDASSSACWSSDYNLIHGTTGPWGLTPMVYFAHEWSAASGQDRHSAHVLPAFADPAKGDFHVSPAVAWGGGLPGAYAAQPVDFTARPAADRDGNAFDVNNVGAYKYPEPVPADGWRKIPVKLPHDKGPRQSAGIYKEDGTLVRMLVSDAAGVRELWWDGRDDAGQPSPEGEYQVRFATHDVRVLDDGNFGDNGNPLGTYNCDNPERLAAMPDGRFVAATVYDEAGIPLRFHAASGQSYAGVNLAEKDIWAIAFAGDVFVAGIQNGVSRISLEGERIPMANGAEKYPILADGEKLAEGFKFPAGLAVLGGKVHVALPGPDIVRVMDLKTGAKIGDWRLAGVRDLASDDAGTLWAISGTDVVSLKQDGQPDRRFPTGLKAPRYLAATAARLAICDRESARIAILDTKTGQVAKVLGQDLPHDKWPLVNGNTFLDPRGVAFLPDGKLLVSEAGRIRAIWPDNAQVAFTAESNFMDAAVPHPSKPEYVYCFKCTVFRVDPATGAWTRIAEGPARPELKASMSQGVVLGGKPFIVSYQPTAGETLMKDGKEEKVGFCRLAFVDVSDPAQPRYAGEFRQPGAWTYSVAGFNKAGDLVMPGPGNPKGGYALRFKILPFKGLDANGCPQFDGAAARIIGSDEGPLAGGLTHNSRFAIDRMTDEIYFTGVTKLHNKMVPAWGASATGAGKCRPDGTAAWFSLSSGGNSTAMDVINDGKNAWFFVPKDFGGQTDVFDSDGLRVATGNWAWPSNWQMGFVDICYGLRTYMRPDGRPGAWIEDDAIGRFTRIVLDGTDTYRKSDESFEWDGKGAPTGPAPVADRLNSASAAAPPLPLPRTAPLPVDGDWAAWEKNGIVPQILALPTPTFARSHPDDLLSTFRAGTAIGAVAHDGENLYGYFVCTDDTQHFDAAQPGMMWAYDGIEFWIEEEQFGLGFLKDGRPALFKYRFHNLEGKEWSANYPLPDTNIWARKYASLAENPLGRQLAEACGISFAGKAGYALMAKIPLKEIRLKGGLTSVPERSATCNLPSTGKPGEILRIGVAFDGINAWGREQDFKVYWPVGLMFSDPTHSIPFALE